MASRVAEVPVEGGTGRAVVSPAASTLREEMAVSGQRLLAASGQIPMAATEEEDWSVEPGEVLAVTEGPRPVAYLTVGSVEVIDG